jgi:hypothetical protein
LPPRRDSGAARFFIFATAGANLSAFQEQTFGLSGTHLSAYQERIDGLSGTPCRAISLIYSVFFNQKTPLTL